MEEPLLFLSYARSDGSTIAARIQSALQARGYQIWLDRDKILTGEDFVEQICAGIRRSKLMIAVMTPYSVRLAGDANNATKMDSVCLNEIHEARFRAKIPVIPVMAIRCEEPFAINTLDYVDITRAAVDGSVWDEGFGRILKRIDAVLAGTPVPVRTRPASLELLDETFERFLSTIRDGFSGREWAFNAVNKWLKDASPPVLVISGAPGSGKSALAAELVYRNTAGQVLAYHVCNADRPVTIDPATFVRSLADMVASRVDEYRATLLDARTRELLDNADNDPSSAFEFALLQPLRSLTTQPTSYILIDGMDEALAATGPKNIVQLLESSVSLLPPWLRFLITCRPGVIATRFDQPWARRLEIKGDNNRSDVKNYLLVRLREPTLAGKLTEAGRKPEDVASWILGMDACNDESNFLFVKLLLNEIEARPSEQLNPDELPRELDALYRSWLGRVFAGWDPNQQATVRGLLGIICTARESLTREQILRIAGPESEPVLTRMLTALAAFLPQTDGRVRPFHKTFRDWLLKDENNYGADMKQGLEAVTACCRQEYDLVRNTRPGMPVSQGDLSGIRHYVLRHGVRHFLSARQFANAVDLLSFLFEHEKVLTADVTAYLGADAKAISRQLEDCDAADAAAIDPLRLAAILRTFYEIEPQYPGVRILVCYHSERWDEILDYLLADDDFVIRFTIASALAEQVDSKTSTRLADIRKLIASQDVNRSEIGAYAIKLVYANMPGAIEPGTLNALATGEVYSSRSVLGDLLIHLAFTGKSRSSLVTAERFWKPIWDFNRLDVWDIKAIELLIAGTTPGVDTDQNVLSAWRALKESEAQRHELLNDKSLPESIRNLLEQYRTLGVNKQPIEAAAADLEASVALGKIMRVLFAHPLWDVAEDAASVLSDMPPDIARPVIAVLLADASWKVRYGAIEAAFGFRYVDNYELFSNAVRQFHNDPNCRLRALCLENFAAQALASEPAQRRRWCSDFSQPIKSWVKDEDCWVLEHVYRLFKQLDNFGDDYQPLLADGVSRLFEGNPAWYTMERGDFLHAIERAKQAHLTAAAA